jgi:glycosyltransferase involved in cell wall biosynthesis
MNICIFAKGLLVHIIGGLEVHTQQLITCLIERGHKVTVITTKHPRGIREERHKNLDIHYVGNHPLKYTREFVRESAKIFNKLDKKENFDIVHSLQNLGSGFVKYSESKKPFVVSMHGTFLYEIKSMINDRSLKNIFIIPYMFIKYLLFYRSLDKILFRKAEKIMVDSKELKRAVMNEFNVAEEKLRLVYDGIDVNKFKPFNVDKFREKMNIKKKDKIIVSSGRILKQKGYHSIIEVLPDILKHMKVKLIIVGDGEYLENLKKLTKKKKVSDKVIFTGRVSEEDLIKYYNLADVFVFPTFRVEAFGIVIAEAMACGKPAIATKIGGIPSVIDDSKNGFLVKMGDLKELRDKLLIVLKDDKLAKKFGEAARKKVVENFSLEKMINDTIKVYEEVINESRRKIV